MARLEISRAIFLTATYDYRLGAMGGTAWGRGRTSIGDIFGAQPLALPLTAPSR